MIQKDTFVKLAYAGTPTRLSLGAAASAVALTIILRHFTAKQPKLITDYEKVARKVHDNGLEFDEWDFIIVGGGMIYLFYCQSFLCSEPRLGTAGCVLASRLSENPNLRVLLIEAGGRSGSSSVLIVLEC